MTSEVMEWLLRRPQAADMTKSLALPAAVLAPFFAYSCYAAQKEGFFGYVPLLSGSLWGVQVGLDLVIALSLFVAWMIRDARERGLPAWPFVATIVPLGSIGALLYLVVRALKGATDPASRAADGYQNG